MEEGAVESDMSVLEESVVLPRESSDFLRDGDEGIPRDTNDKSPVPVIAVCDCVGCLRLFLRYTGNVMQGFFVVVPGAYTRTTFV